MKVSLTIIGLILLVLGRIVGMNDSGLKDVLDTLGAVTESGGLFIAWYGRYRQGDITIFGRKKRK